jgi:hypothetical protein
MPFRIPKRHRQQPKSYWYFIDPNNPHHITKVALAMWQLGKELSKQKLEVLFTSIY